MDRTFIKSLVACLAIPAVMVMAGEQASSKEMEKPSMKSTVEERKVQISQEFEASTGYVAGGNSKIGDQKFGSNSEINSSASYVISPKLNDNALLRVGAQFENYSYGLPSTAKSDGFMLPQPNTLRSVNAVIGADITLNDQWLMRVEVSPGVYSDFADIGSSDINSPFIIGASYLVDKDLQWFMGASVDLWRDIPVLPGVGVRWKFAEQWTLMFLLPKPRLVYDVTDRINLFVGSELKGGSYRVGKNFGSEHGRSQLNNEIVDYSEIRIGGGAEWKALPFLSVELQGGYVPYRSFDYHRAGTTVKVDGAPYVQLAASAKF